MGKLETFHTRSNCSLKAKHIPVHLLRSGQIRVAKCQFFYTDQNLQSRFYPKTIAYIATILALKLNKTDDKGSFGEQMFQAYQIRLEADVGMANSNPYVCQEHPTMLKKVNLIYHEKNLAFKPILGIVTRSMRKIGPISQYQEERTKII